MVSYGVIRQAAPLPELAGLERVCVVPFHYDLSVP